MFQYAYIKAAALRNRVPFKLDISEYQTYFRSYELGKFHIDRYYAESSEIPYYERWKSKNKYLNI